MIPPSIGIHGGGQHEGEPPGGGGGAEMPIATNVRTKTRQNTIRFDMLSLKKQDKYTKKVTNYNCFLKIMPKIYIC